MPLKKQAYFQAIELFTFILTKIKCSVSLQLLFAYEQPFIAAILYCTETKHYLLTARKLLIAL
ncbi:hypothetical protein C3K47_04000 [Solitalea longa]|uniref:Uncharacterized protein n=1 Tax=Solitalea longa TaxID=2079460 RepID=A0A2S5A7R2_9SPHI|nr:hypothetical protein C3K47_04000 [Solitalea longa]